MAQKRKTLLLVFKTTWNIIGTHLLEHQWHRHSEMSAQSPKDTKRQQQSKPKSVHLADIWTKTQKHPLPYHQTMRGFIPQAVRLIHPPVHPLTLFCKIANFGKLGKNVPNDLLCGHMCVFYSTWTSFIPCNCEFKKNVNNNNKRKKKLKWVCYPAGLSVVWANNLTLLAAFSL